MDTNEYVNLVLEGNGWDLNAIPINDWLPTAAVRLNNSRPELNVIEDPQWFKNITDEARAWFDEADSLLEFFLDNYDVNTVISSMQTLMVKYNLPLTPILMPTWERFTVECGPRLLEMAAAE